MITNADIFELLRRLDDAATDVDSELGLPIVKFSNGNSDPHNLTAVVREWLEAVLKP